MYPVPPVDAAPRAPAAPGAAAGAPRMAGLGTHATIDLHGGTRFGPDVEWLAAQHGLPAECVENRAAGKAGHCQKKDKKATNVRKA